MLVKCVLWRKVKGTKQTFHFCLEVTGTQMLKCMITLKHDFFQAFLIFLFLRVGLGFNHWDVPLFQVGCYRDPSAKWGPLCACWSALLWQWTVILFCQGKRMETHRKRTREMGQRREERQRGESLNCLPSAWTIWPRLKITAVSLPLDFSAQSVSTF